MADRNFERLSTKKDQNSPPHLVFSSQLHVCTSKSHSTCSLSVNLQSIPTVIHYTSVHNFLALITKILISTSPSDNANITGSCCSVIQDEQFHISLSYGLLTINQSNLTKSQFQVKLFSKWQWNNCRNQSTAC